MRLVEEAANYAGAETTCAVDGGRLVKIADNGVRQIVSSYYQGENWIGKAVKHDWCLIHRAVILRYAAVEFIYVLSRRLIPPKYYFCFGSNTVCGYESGEPREKLV